MRGFSLIELLVAVFVIVLLTGVVSLNVGRGGADVSLEGEVRHLADLLSYTRMEAGMSATDHGLLLHYDPSIRPSRYQGQWLRRFDQGWAAPRTSIEVFGDVMLAEGYELRLSLDGQPDVELTTFDPDLKQPPQVIAWAGGEITPGSLDWLDRQTGEVLYRLEWDLLGRMSLMPKGIEPDESEP